jgi:hypothetical protein
VSLLPLKFGKIKFGSWCPDEVFHFAITVISAVSMTPLKFEYNRFSRRIRSHMRNGFRPWIRALGDYLMKKNRGSKISCNCPFNETTFLYNILDVDFVSLLSRIKTQLTSMRITNQQPLPQQSTQ